MSGARSTHAVVILLLCAASLRPGHWTECSAASRVRFAAPSGRFPLCPLEIPAIKTIIITENAAKAPADTDPDVSCESFRVNENTVRQYFAAAKVTDANDAHHTLDWSPCYATGEMILEDGSKGRWSLSQLKSGSLVIGDGNSQTLYCPTCAFEPFQ
jgi:hypothetical protein